MASKAIRPVIGAFSSAASSRPALQHVFTNLNSMGSAVRSALRTKSPENNLAFANHSLTQRTRSGLGYVVPIHIFNIPAAVADKVVMPHASCVESRGAALDGHFPHQSRLHQVAQVVVCCGSGREGIRAIHCCEDFCSRGMPRVIHQERHHCIPLCRAAQTCFLQRPFNCGGSHSIFEYI
jgi:hypothetical protein